MRYGNIVFVLLTILGTSVSWWPLLMEPSLDLPFWVPLACVTGCTGLLTLLAPALWLSLLLAAGIGTYGGLWLGFLIWPPHPPAGSWVPYVVYVMTLAVLLIALCASLLLRRRSLSNEAARRAVWVAIFVCVAFGPVTFALTPPLVRNRIAHNDRLAAERFASLKKAVESTKAEAGGSDQICDGMALQRYYAGPPFSEKDWRRITGNYVQQDGYSFMVYCREKRGGYTIDAHPRRAVGDGTRRFCTDESGRVGCRMKWNVSRKECLPCP